MTYDVKCKMCNHEEEWFNITLNTYEDRKINYKCPNCNKIGTMQQLIQNAPPIFYHGIGWSNAGRGYVRTSQQKLDDALRENDQLQHISKTTEGRKRADAIKKAEDLGAKYT